jgi:uncharacterized protein (TIGR00288 family)
MTEIEKKEASKPKRRGRRGGVRHRKKTEKAASPALEPPFEVSEPAPPSPQPVAPETLTFSSSGGPTPMSNNQAEEQRLAVFIDFDNLAIGAREAKYPKFDLNLMLERLLEKGRIVYKKAYADWSRYLDYKRPFHEAAVELIDIPQRSYTGKNSADIRMVVDAMDLCYSKGHITTFVIASGDSDFSPLVSKLKENDKAVLGVGVKNSSSDLLVSNCDEFIFYEDLVRAPAAGSPSLDQLPEKKREVFRLMLDSILALKRENKDVIWGSMVKQTMQRKKPYFNESYYGFDSFSSLLEEAQKLKLVTLKKDTKSGGYIVSA